MLLGIVAIRVLIKDTILFPVFPFTMYTPSAYRLRPPRAIATYANDTSDGHPAVFGKKDRDTTHPTNVKGLSDFIRIISIGKTHTKPFSSA
jgi:hypothetical protein